MIVEVQCDDCGGAGAIDDVRCLACDGRGQYAQLADDEAAPNEETPIADASTPVDHRPLALQMLMPRQGDIDRLVKVPCMVCGKEVEIPQHIYDAVRRHNKLESQRADQSASDPYPYIPQFITNRQIAACVEPVNGETNPCTLAVRAQIRRASDEAHVEMRHHFDEMKKGSLTYEGAQFLRRAGYGEDVKAYYERQAKAAAAPTEKPAEKPKRERKGRGNKQQAATVLSLVPPEPGDRADG